MGAGVGRLTLLVRRLLLGAVIGAALVAPVAVQYWRVQQREGFGRSLTQASQGSAAPASYLQAPPVNLLYGRTGLLGPRADRDAGLKPTEQMLFPGFALVALAAAGLWAGRRRTHRSVALAWGLLIAAGYLLSLGPEGVRPLYAGLYHLVFGFHGIRAPARFAVLVLFGLAGLAGLGLARLVGDRPGSGRAVALCAVGLLAVEYANAPIPYVPAPRAGGAVAAWLRAEPGPGAVIHLPLTLDPARNTAVMVESLGHGRPIVNGYSGERPSFYSALADTMAGFPSADALRTLHELPVRFIVTSPGTGVQAAPLVERARFDEGTVYELRWTPEAEAGLEPPEAVAAPEPGPVPFGPGEAAVYAVTWTSGPLALRAGQVVLSVEPGADGARYELHASGTTAPWVSQFFEADDRFVSAVDERLRPVVHEQHLREGRRRVDRRMVFDWVRHLVHVHQGDGEIPFPVPRDARDPLSAFYYVRSLPLEPGQTVRLPVNDSGRTLVLELRVASAGAVAYLGTQTEALRVDARLLQSGGRQMPVRIAAWFSRDARQIPLVIDVDGIVGAGSVRLELESLSAEGPPRPQ